MNISLIVGVPMEVLCPGQLEREKNKVRGNKRKYIHLFNCHNGYYSHGFEFKIGEKVVKEGNL